NPSQNHKRAPVFGSQATTCVSMLQRIWSLPPTLATMGVPRAPISFEESFRTPGLVVFPEQFAGLQVERGQKGPVARTEVQDDLTAMEDWRGAIAIFIAHFTEVRFPKFLAVEVVAKDPGGAVPDHHTRALSNGRGPAVRIRWVRRLDSGKLDRPHPKLLARSAVEAVQVSLLARVFLTSDK